jgi:hypothetical protein
MSKQSKEERRSEPGFAQIENRVLDLLEQDVLTKTERRLFWYLFKLDRFGNRFVKLPSQKQIAEHLGVRRETINIAQSKLQRLGLFDFQVDGWKARNLVAPKSNTVLDKSLRVLEKSNRVLEENNTLLDCDRTELEESNSGIYIERAHDRSISDLNSDLNSDLSQKESEGEAVPVEAEIVTDSHQDSPRFAEEKNVSLSQVNQVDCETKFPTPGCDNNAQESEVLRRYENGEIEKLPRHELLKLAKQQLAEVVKAYRGSGMILNSKPNDIDRGFVAFIAKRDRKDSEYASRLILACERTPERWTELTEMVKSWKTTQVLGCSRERAASVHSILSNIADL